MVACVQVRVRKFPERLPMALLYLTTLFFPWLSVRPLVRLCVHSGLSLAHHQRGTDFVPCDVYEGPLLCPPSTSARVQNRFEFVERDRDMSSN